jgi:hypothetical protein
MGKGKGWMGVWRKLELADEGCVALQGEALAEAVVSCEVKKQWRKGTNSVAASHMRMIMPSPQENPDAIKSDVVYPMKVSLVDVDGLTRVFHSTWVRISLLHVLRSEHRVAEARL